jgi:hypothetical protein
MPVPAEAFFLPFQVALAAIWNGNGGFAKTARNRKYAQFPCGPDAL